MKSPRSRRDTRAAILSGLWVSKGAFRPQLIDKTDLTPASISRITAELKDEGLIEEERRPAPYQGGPSGFLTLSKNNSVAAFELSSGHLHSAVGSLDGELRYAERIALPDGASSTQINTALTMSIAHMAQWISAHSHQPMQIGISVPGYHPGQERNPIIAFNPLSVERCLADTFAGTPVVIANSMVARALAYSLHKRGPKGGASLLFVYVGHGIGAAYMPSSPDAGDIHAGDIEPCEIGHMIMEQNSVVCRCGHHGCLEPLASSVAVAKILGVSESELIELGDDWANTLPISDEARSDIGLCLSRLGTAIGNALNIRRLHRVVLTGWPAALPKADRHILVQAIDKALFGGAGGVDVSFIPSNLGREPTSGLALAVHGFIRRGGERLIPLTKHAS